MKKLLAMTLAAVLVFSLAACGGQTAPTPTPGSETPAASGAEASKDVYVGVAMPTQSSQRWIQDGGNMKSQLEAKGYKVDLQYAEDVVENQISQIENMITKGVNILVIASIDGESLTDVLQKAADANIPVIAYDRLIRNTPNVSYYATFDNFKVGVLQATSLIEGLGLTSGKDGPFNIELFGGSPDDNNAYFFYDGAMSVLQPYIDEGKLVVVSGQTGMENVATLRWDGALAQTRMENLISGYYTSKELHGVLSPYDGISIGILAAVKAVGYGSADKPMPIITGQDAEIASVKSIKAGEQYSTVFKDTRSLAAKVVEMVDAILQGKEAPVNDTTTYDNGVKVVPSYLLESVSVDSRNIKEALIDTGYYTEAEIS